MLWQGSNLKSEFVTIRVESKGINRESYGVIDHTDQAQRVWECDRGL